MRRRVHAHVGLGIARVRRTPTTPALVELHDQVAVRIEVAPTSGTAAGARSAMDNQRRLPARVTACLPVDAVAFAYIEQAFTERFDERIRLHDTRLRDSSPWWIGRNIACASSGMPPDGGSARGLCLGGRVVASL